MGRFSLALAMWFAVVCISETSLAAGSESKLVTRVDGVAVTARGRTLAIRVIGMGRTPTRFPRGGRLLRHNQERQLNSEGLLEYDLVFNQPAGYAGFNLQRVTAKLKEKSPPAGVKGVRVFGEYNHYDGLLPEPKKKKSLLPSFRRHKEAGAVTSGSPAP